MLRLKCLVLIPILSVFIQCVPEKQEVDPATRLFALLYLLNRRDVSFQRVRFLNGKFFATGTLGQIYESTDGESWTKQNLPTQQLVYDIGFRNDVYTVIANTKYYESTNASTWNDISTTFNSTSGLYGIGNFLSSYSVAFGIYSFTATSGRWSDSSTLISSSAFSTSAGYFGSAANSNRLILVGSNASSRASILSSSFIVTTLVLSSSSITGISSVPSLRDVAFGSGTFVAVGASGTIVRSSSGLDWTSVSSNAVENLFGICFGDRQFVAVGSNGAILRSSDGSNWTKQTLESATSLASVAYGNGKYVAAGGSSIFVSSDGITWTSK